MNHPWIADRLHKIDASGIRKVFDLAANMQNPINLSIGQPHFDTPEVIKEAAKRAIDSVNQSGRARGLARVGELATHLRMIRAGPIRERYHTVAPSNSSQFYSSRTGDLAGFHTDSEG